MTDALVTTLAAAFRSREQVAVASLAAPPDVAAGMAAQAALATEIGDRIAGWKVGTDRSGVPVAGPILEGLMVPDAGRHPLPPQGTSAIEVEIAARLAQDLPPRAGGYDRESVLSACDRVMVGIEIVESRLDDFRKAAYPLFLAELMGNRGFVEGDGIPVSPGMALDRLRCTVEIDGKLVHDAPGGHAKGDPFVMLVDYVNNPVDRLGGLRKGQFVTMGTLCGLIAVTGPCAFVATVETIGTVRLEMV